MTCAVKIHKRFNYKLILIIKIMDVKCNYCLGSGKDELLYQDYTPTENDECPYCDGTGLDPAYNFKDEEE